MVHGLSIMTKHILLCSTENKRLKNLFKNTLQYDKINKSNIKMKGDV